MINSLPLSGSRQINRVSIEGLTESGREPAMAIRGVSHAYHAVLGIPLLDGRLMERGDMEAPGVALISQRAAELSWPGVDPIGTRIRIGSADDLLTVVGVVGDVRHGGARGEVLTRDLCALSAGDPDQQVVRGPERAPRLPADTPCSEDVLARVDLDQPIREIRSMQEWADRQCGSGQVPELPHVHRGPSSQCLLPAPVSSRRSPTWVRVRRPGDCPPPGPWSRPGPRCGVWWSGTPPT